ncbi:hypothetical protein MNBD_ALPHA11-2069 [hydrothermal vent metagenome]|uniref:Uncharacterized protein n=1 Tax=hydrothermal vent metagenome TaxID=652676 RepID=A0A3B0ULI7_9ZZZZ
MAIFCLTLLCFVIFATIDQKNLLKYAWVLLLQGVGQSLLSRKF